MLSEERGNAMQMFLQKYKYIGIVGCFLTVLMLMLTSSLGFSAYVLKVETPKDFLKINVAHLPIISDEDAVRFAVHSSPILKELSAIEDEIPFAAWKATASQNEEGLWETRFISVGSIPSCSCQILFKSNGELLQKQHYCRWNK
jgi:hypothetical protein